MERQPTTRPSPVAVRYAVLGALLVALATGFAWAHAAKSPSSSPIITVSTDVPVFTPRITLVQPDQDVAFRNSTAQDMLVTATAHSPAPFQLRVVAGGSGHLRLHAPGLYHFYDAVTAQAIDYQAGNDVVHAREGAPNPALADQGWIFVTSTDGVASDAFIHVPANHDLLAPRAAVVRVGGSVLIHNHDTDAHNLVTDPADPTGAAFEVLGTDGEPALGGAERRLTFTRPGLYHVYCSIHARVVGDVGGWQVIIPRDDSATGFADGDPMEAWILVLP